MATLRDDWYPQPLAERVDWHINLDNQAVDFREKYGWSAAQVASIHADRLWIEYWYHAREEVDIKRGQLTKYISTISGNKTDADVPLTVDFTPSNEPPAEVPPGIEARTRELRRETVNKSVYAKADGALLGFERSAPTLPDLAQMFPEFSLRTLVNYQIEASFLKQGMDAVRFEYRYKGGNWMPLGDKASSPAILTISPQTAGEAVQIEIRAIFLRKYQTVGNYSPSYSIVAAQ